MDLLELELSEKEQFEAIKKAAEKGIGTAKNPELADNWRKEGQI